MVKHSKKIIIGKKGSLFFDEGANKKLIKPTHEAGYSVKLLPLSYRNIKTSDSTVAGFAKKMPIVTDDYTCYKESAKKGTAYIEPATVKPENFPAYEIKWKNFLLKNTSKTLKGYIWKVLDKGEVKKIKLNK